MNKQLINNYPNDLTHKLYGLLLGDGGIYKVSSSTSNSRFEMSFGGEYKPFALFIEDLLKDFIKTPVKEVIIKGKNKSYTNFRVKTITSPLFNELHSMFYEYDNHLNKYIKRVPDNILNIMDPAVLAYLIMSDGNFNKHSNRIRIYTNSFKEQDVRKLAESIHSNLNIYCPMGWSAL